LEIGGCVGGVQAKAFFFGGPLFSEHRCAFFLHFPARLIERCAAKEIVAPSALVLGMKWVVLCMFVMVRREKAPTFSGHNPTRQLSLQPVAIGAAMEVTKSPKPSMERTAWRSRE
jgi:hypothetical protein